MAMPALDLVRRPQRGFGAGLAATPDDINRLRRCKKKLPVPYKKDESSILPVPLFPTRGRLVRSACLTGPWCQVFAHVRPGSSLK